MGLIVAGDVIDGVQYGHEDARTPQCTAWPVDTARSARRALTKPTPIALGDPRRRQGNGTETDSS